MTKSLSNEQRVIDYLTRLMSGRFFQIEDLESLTVQDLAQDTPVQDIDKAILEKALTVFRAKYKSEIFKDSSR